MRLIPTSLALVGLTVAAGLAGCGSDAPSNTAGGGSGPSSNAAGSGTAPTGGKPGVVPGAGGSGQVATGGSGTNPGTGGSGQVGTGGSGTNPSTGGSGQVGTGGSGTSTGGTSSTGGKSSTGGSGAADPNAPDMNGKTNAKPGAMTSANLDYLKLGEIRLINNNWGSVAWGCAGSKSNESVFINSDKSFGWKFDRQAGCAGDSTKPDFPEIEFGIHPFGLGSKDATSPNFSSTTLLPIQIKDLKSASVVVKNLNVQLDKSDSWDLTFEFWLSKQNPATTKDNAGVYAELMTFWGCQPNRWPLNDGGKATCENGGGKCDSVEAGTNYNLVVQKNSWGSGWQYYQFRTANSSTSFNGTVDVKKLIDYLMKRDSAVTGDMWVTRFEVGTEIDDNTKGTAKIENITFEVNQQTRSPVFGQ